MKRAEEFEIWERSKRKEQKYIRTKNSSTKIYYLPKNHNDSTLTALENTMDEIDEEIRTARELFEDELQKISSRAEQNPNAVRLHNTIKYIVAINYIALFRTAELLGTSILMHFLCLILPVYFSIYERYS